MARSSALVRPVVFMLVAALCAQGIAHTVASPAAATQGDPSRPEASGPPVNTPIQPGTRPVDSLDSTSCLFDDFERSETGGWGDATPGSGTWVLLQGNTDSFDSYSVTGGRGYIDATPGNTGPTDGDPGLRVIQSFSDPLTISFEFEVDALEGNPFHEPQFYMVSSAGSTSPTLVTSSTYDVNGNPLSLVDPSARPPPLRTTRSTS